LKSILLQYGQEKNNQYSNNLSSLPLELCSYCKSSLSLSMDALCLSSGATTTLAKANISSTSATTTLVKASGDNHDGITYNSIPCVDTDGIIGVALSSEQHYKNNNNSLRIL
jgi:hypothetical protein